MELEEFYCLFSGCQLDALEGETTKNLPCLCKKTIEKTLINITRSFSLGQNTLLNCIIKSHSSYDNSTDNNKN